MRLVMVHGRAQEGRDPTTLKKEWLDALAYGLARANATLPPDTTIEFPYYGDLLATLVANGDAPLAADVRTGGAPHPDQERELRGEMLAEMAAGLGLTEADIE